MKKKLFLALAMVLVALLLVAGCGGGSNEPAQEPEAPPADSQPAETETVESEPADSQPADAEPAESEPAQSEPAESKPADSKPAESQPADSKPAEEAKSEPQEEANAGGDGQVGAVDEGKCSGCHGSVDKAVATISNHPSVDSLSGCAPCHGAGSSMGELGTILHDGHKSLNLSCDKCHQ